MAHRSEHVEHGAASRVTGGHRPYVAQAADQQRLAWIGGGVMRVLFDGERTGGQLTLLRTQLRRGDAAPVHVHGYEDEMFVLLAGTGIVWVGDARYELQEGGVVFLPRAIPHAYCVTSETMDVLTLCTPAGLEGFFRAVGHDLRQPLPVGWAPDPAVMAEAMRRHGGRILGPPKTAAD